MYYSLVNKLYSKGLCSSIMKTCNRDIFWTIFFQQSYIIQSNYVLIRRIREELKRSLIVIAIGLQKFVRNTLLLQKSLFFFNFYSLLIHMLHLYLLYLLFYPLLSLSLSHYVEENMKKLIYVDTIYHNFILLYTQRQRELKRKRKKERD